MRTLRVLPFRRLVPATAAMLTGSLVFAPVAEATLKWKSKPTKHYDQCGRGFSTESVITFRAVAGQALEFGIKNSNPFFLNVRIVQRLPSKNQGGTTIAPGQTRWVRMAILAEEPVKYEWEFSTPADSHAINWYVVSNRCVGVSTR